MGLLIGAGNTKPDFPYNYYYGVKIDTTVKDTPLERVGLMNLHVNLPVQSMMRRCLVDDNGKVVRYLHPTNSNKTDTGATSDLTGASGMVMVEIPEHYRKIEFDGTVITAMISTIPLPGFHKVRKVYRSAYEASLDRTNNKLASVVNKTEQFRGGNNNASWDGTYRSLLSVPATSIPLTNFRKFARNRGEAGLNGCGWNCDLYEATVNTFWLYTIEYANLWSQAPFTAQLDANGFHQGGLGDGVTTMPDWGGFNGYQPFIPCGVTNSLGNKTGIVTYECKNENGDLRKAIDVPSYRGLENPFGHLWCWCDGLHIMIQSDADGGKSLLYRATNDDPAAFQDTNNDGYELRGELSRREGFITKILAGEFGDIMPLEVGGSSTTGYTDYFWTSIPGRGTDLRGVRFGASAYYGARAGLSCANTTDGPASAYTAVGSRLCFIPAT